MSPESLEGVTGFGPVRQWAMRWLRPENWPRTPEDWIDAAANFPVTPGEWLKAAEELSESRGRMLADLLEAIGERFVGRELVIRSGDQAARMVIDKVDTSSDRGAPRPRRLDIDTVSVVSIEAHDVRWANRRVDRAQAVLRNVRMEPGLVAHLVAGPVELTAEIDQATLDQWVADSDDLPDVRLDHDGLVTLVPRRFVRALVRPEIVERQVHVHLSRLAVFGIPVPFARRLRARVIDLPRLHRDVRITDAEPAVGTIKISAALDRLREPVHPDRILRAASGASSRVVLDRLDDGRAGS